MIASPSRSMICPECNKDICIHVRPAGSSTILVYQLHGIMYKRGYVSAGGHPPAAQRMPATVEDVIYACSYQGRTYLWF